MVETRHTPSRETGGSAAQTEKLAKHPEATPAGGPIRHVYQAVRDFSDLHGCGWGRGQLIPVPDEDVEELLARGDIRIYEGLVLGDHLGEPISQDSRFVYGTGLKLIPAEDMYPGSRKDVGKASHKAS